MSHTISLQYLEQGDVAPRAGYPFTDASLTLPAGATVPRIGDFFQQEGYAKKKVLSLLDGGGSGSDSNT